MTRRLLPGIALLAAVLSGVAGCGPSTPDAVPVASGDGPLGPWVASVHHMANGLFPDERVCVRVDVQGQAPIESGCGAVDPATPGGEVMSVGADWAIVIGQTSKPTATQARIERDGAPDLVVPVGSGSPITEARWVVAWEKAAAPGDLPRLRVTFLDAAGAEVETIDF